MSFAAGVTKSGMVPLPAGQTGTSAVQRLALKTLLHLGLVKVDSLRFRQQPVALQQAQRRLEELLPSKDSTVKVHSTPCMLCMPPGRGVQRGLVGCPVPSAAAAAGAVCPVVAQAGCAVCW